MEIRPDTTSFRSQSRIGGPPIRKFGIYPVMSMLNYNASAVGMAACALYRRAADTVLGLLSSHLESCVLSADTDLASADRASSPKLDRQLIPRPIRQ